ncbi:MAG: outer membrane beta-barrel protein [Ramlibacter sp.]
MERKSHSLASIHKLSLVTLAVLASTSALADDPMGWYIGGSAGPSTARFSTPSSVGLIGPGLAVTSISGRERDKFAFKLYGGYQFHRNFAVEGGYFDLGDNRYTFNTTPAGTLNGVSEVRGLNLDLVGKLPVTDRFTVLGRVGAAYARDRTHFTNTGAVPPTSFSPRTSKTNAKYGVGVQYAFTDQLSVRAELERYRIEDPIRRRGNIDMVSVGLVYHFGAKAREPMRQTTYVPPPVVAAPPPPPPRVVAAPPPPPPAPPPVMAPPPPPPPPVYMPPERPAKPGRY